MDVAKYNRGHNVPKIIPAVRNVSIDIKTIGWREVALWRLKNGPTLAHVFSRHSYRAVSRVSFN